MCSSMSVQQAILVELFAILLVLFGSLTLLNGGYPRFEWVLIIGLCIGIISVMWGLFDGFASP